MTEPIANNTGLSSSGTVEQTPQNMSILQFGAGDANATALIKDVGGAFDRSKLNDNFASLATQINELTEAELPKINQNIATLTEAVNDLIARLAMQEAKQPTLTGGK